MTMPPKIWVTDGPHYGYWFDISSPDLEANEITYIRADRVEKLVAALLHAHRWPSDISTPSAIAKAIAEWEAEQ